MKFSSSFILAALPFLAAVSALPAHPRPESGDDAPPAAAHANKPQSDDETVVVPDEFNGVHIPNSVLDELKAHPNEMYYLYEDGKGKNVEQENRFLEFLIKNAVEHGVKKAIQKAPGKPHNGERSHGRHHSHEAKEVEPRTVEESSESPSPSAKPARRTRSKKRLQAERGARRREQRLRRLGILPAPTSQRPTGSRRRQGQGGQSERPKRQRQRQSKKTSVTSED
ncbi:hypothetical protein FA13DRAFT_1734839 [Coprinellus micaceus]|uniref:Uncharacterized protein n=1 Tax=Coprinellus micaceus TaxID=71717 RepID=A0A4Y7T4U1_COPMI|nr:hypothetical protein FA13DRAFT_1734839 [Coprinellus micaceus]